MDILFLLANVAFIAAETFFFGNCIESSRTVKESYMVYVLYAPSFLFLLTAHMVMNTYMVLKVLILRKDKKIVDIVEEDDENDL